MKRLISILAATATLVLAAEPQIPPLVPVEKFFARPAIAGLTFSPNGRYLACRVPFEGRMNVAVIDLEKMEKKLLTALKDRDIQRVLWANNERLVFTSDPGGHENPFFYAIKRDGTDAVTLREGGELKEGAANLRVRGILARIEGDPDHILVAADIGQFGYPDVCRMNLVTGKVTVVVPNPGRVREWVLDRDNNVRLAITGDRDHHTIMTRPIGSKGAWTVIHEFNDLTPHWEPLAFDGDGTLYVASDIGRHTAAIYRYDLEKCQMGEMVAADDTFDVADMHDGANSSAGTVIYDHHRKKITGFSYYPGLPKTVWVDAEAEKFHKMLDASLPGYDNSVSSVSEDGTRLLVFSRNDRDLGVYSLFDAKRKRIDELAVLKPQLDPEHMAPMRPITFAARDGLELHGYLTLPVGREPKNLPLIIHPHGGPYGPRDVWGFDPEVQFYANRGFAVLQINYRGSGGRGLSFLKAGYKRWGLEMQDDLSDGVKWAIAQGIANPARVVISGASYGGYAAMAGLVYTPELYCAGINYVGVTDLTLLLPKTMSPSLGRWRQTRIGDIQDAADRKRIEETSPVNAADRIRAPLLMGYGKNDPRVNIEHCYAMERALKRAGKSYELIIQEDEGHGFREEAASIGFYRRVDEFLKQHALARTPMVEVGDPHLIKMPVALPAKR